MRLRYTTDTLPGFTRKKIWGFFAYFTEDGKRIREKTVLKRIQSLGIPPAYTHVWICPFEHGHIQATALDARGRRQYIYHPDWIAQQKETKFHRMELFASVLSPIRRRVSHDVALRGMPKEKVLAAIVRLLDTTYIRIGNETYAEKNHSFGLTTLQDRHMQGRGAHMRLVFRGKSGVSHEVALHDARLRNIVATCHDLPGHELFAYIDDAGKVRDVSSEDVNLYVKKISQEEITAKDFRTWHATVIAAEYLFAHPLPQKKHKAQRYIKNAVQQAARALGNTPTVCKASYIHPGLFSWYLQGRMVPFSPRMTLRKKYPRLHVGELMLLDMLSDF